MPPIGVGFLNGKHYCVLSLMEKLPVLQGGGGNGQGKLPSRVRPRSSAPRRVRRGGIFHVGLKSHIHCPVAYWTLDCVVVFIFYPEDNRHAIHMSAEK